MQRDPADLSHALGYIGLVRTSAIPPDAALGRLGCELDDLARTSQFARLLPRVRMLRLDVLCEELARDWRVIVAATGIELRSVVPPTLVRSGRVLVGCKRAGDRVRIEVHDNGRGIASRRLADIFEAFERGDAEGVVSGLGLGLFLVRQAVEVLHHPVEVRSLEGSGSSFSVTRPRVFND